ncbi:MAG: SH3 domain-containing protein [Sarcina sp.]
MQIYFISSTEGTGFKNRGIRINLKLYELRKTSMLAIIVETYFCEATEDIAIYKEKGPDEIGKLIVEGISNKKVSPYYNDENSSNEKCATVTASILNVRSGEGTNYPVIGQVKKGDRIKLECKVGEW